jgi:hypothetical protein
MMMAFEPICQSLRFRSLTVRNRVSRATASGRFIHDRDARYPSRESMIAEKMSVFSPPFVC